MAMTAQEYLDTFNAAINSGAYEDAARILRQAEGDFGPGVYDVAGVVLEANPNLPPEIDYMSPQGIQSIKDYVANVTTPVAPPPAPAPVNTFDTQLSGLFDQYLGRAPTDRELGIYRKDFGAEIDPTEITEFLRRSEEEIRNRGNLVVNDLFEGNNIPTPDQINQALESSGGFGTTAAPNRGIAGLPRFEQQAFTPLTFAPLRRGTTQLAGPARMTGLTSGQPAFGGTYDIATRPVAATPFALPQDFALQTGAYGAPIPTSLSLPPPTEVVLAPPPATPETGNSDNTGGNKAGGMIKMAEGGEAMAKLSPAEAGSKFDVSEFIDEQGRLVGGYSRPIRDQYGVITGYDYQPYQRDVVFNPRLAEAEARGMSDEEREAARRGLIVRQGMTGVDPYAGGLAGIVAREAMMRNRPQYYSYAKGGDVSETAQDLASRGRGGDTMLVHMAPHEVAGLNALARMQGTELTINPETGMPEALKLGKLFKQLAPMALGFALGPAGAGIFSSALGAGLAVGAGYTLATGSLQQGIAAGLGAYGGSNLGAGLQAAGAEAATSATAGEVAGSGVSSALGGGAAEAAMVNPMAPVDYSLAAPGAAEGVRLGTTGGFQATLPEISNVSLTSAGPTAGSVATGLGGGVAPVVPTTTTVPIETVQIGGPQAGMRATELATVPQSTSGSALTGAERMLGDKATRDLATQRFAEATGSTLGGTGMAIAGGMGLQSAAEQEAAIRAKQAGIAREEDERRRLYEELFASTLGRVRTAKAGGLMKLAGGGMTYMEAGGTTGPTGTPRDVTGTGDGMSDSVPATIEGVQEARLADGEFVIPADVVADIGNGSSDAGSKKLYDMMDRIRMARHGTKEQPPEIKAERLMPA